MAGLVAVISRSSDRPVSGRELDELATAYERVRGGKVHSTAAAGTRARVAKIAQDTGPRSPIEFRGSAWVAAAGNVHCSRALVGAAPEEYDGQFALVSYDADAAEILVATDAFAMQGLYIAQAEGRTYVSTSALALARYLAARPDRRALLAFLRAGYHFGTMTHWEGIERLDPGVCIRFVDGRQEPRMYFAPTVDHDVARMDFGRAVDHCIEVAVDTYRRYLGSAGPAMADLTAGYDSRLLSLLVRKAGVRFDTDTRGTPTNEDVRVARQMAELAGWPWRQFDQPPDWASILPTMLDTALGWSDGHLDVIQLSWVLWVHQQIGITNPQLLIAGGGEHYRGFAWRQEFLRGGRSNQVRFDNWLDMRLLHPMNTTLFRHDPTREVREDFRQRMVARAEPYDSELNTTQLDVLYAYKMTGHFGAYRSADGVALDAILPFYFKPVFTAAFSINHRYRDAHRLMRHMIDRLDPRIAALPTSAGGPAQPRRPGNLHRFLPYYGDLAFRASKKLSQQAFGRPLFPQEPPRRYFGPERRAVLNQVGGGRPITHEDMRSGSLYKPGELDEFLRRAQDGDFPDTNLLGRILTVELALRAAETTLE